MATQKIPYLLNFYFVPNIMVISALFDFVFIYSALLQTTTPRLSCKMSTMLNLVC